jgi:hypothetical protein
LINGTLRGCNAWIGGELFVHAGSPIDGTEAAP